MALCFKTWWKKCSAVFLLLFVVLASPSYSRSKSIIHSTKPGLLYQSQYVKVLTNACVGLLFCCLPPFFFLNRCTFKDDCAHSENSENWLDISSGPKRCPQIHISRRGKDKVRGKILICLYYIVSFCTIAVNFLLCVKCLLAIKYTQLGQSFI